MPMTTTKLLSSNATKPEANIRGVTKRCTGLIPSTSIASISSRMVRDPRSAQMAVEPAPATINTVTSGPTCVTAPNAAPAPDKSAAPSSRNWKGRRNTNRTASADIANNPPTACIGPDKLLIGGNPADHRSGPLPRDMDSSFEAGHCRHSSGPTEFVRQANPCSVHLFDRLAAKLREQLYALHDAGRAGWMTLDFQSPSRLHAQTPADRRHVRFDEFVAPEPLGESVIFIADQLGAREEIVNFFHIDVR